MRQYSLIAWSTLILAILLWGGFGYMVTRLYVERAAYSEERDAQAQQVLRNENITRLSALVRDTAVERASLDSLFSVSLLDAVEFIENTADDAGVDQVSISEASPLPKGKDTPEGITVVRMVVQADGSFASLVRAVHLYETLTLPSTLDQFDLALTKDTWHLTARLTVYLGDVQ